MSKNLTTMDEIKFGCVQDENFDENKEETSKTEGEKLVKRKRERQSKLNILKRQKPDINTIQINDNETVDVTVDAIINEEQI